jgi:nucleoid-associated protein YgaU
MVFASPPCDAARALPFETTRSHTMGIISFFKEAAGAAPSTPDPAAAQANVAELNRNAGVAIAAYVAEQKLSAEGLDISFDGATSTVTVAGVAPDQATKEKIVLGCGNVTGVSQVNDLMTVAAPADESTWHTVEKGDTLSKIAKGAYGDANAYMKIFEANKPMLKHPGKIYPGQLLRIPPK